MLISEYLQMRNLSAGNISVSAPTRQSTSPSPAAGSSESFAEILKTQYEKQASGVEFSRHALDRLIDRNIDLSEGNKLERLNKAVEAAQEKGANDTLVLIDSTAFLVSVKNNKVITTLSADDLQGNVFTNIDSTVIM